MSDKSMISDMDQTELILLQAVQKVLWGKNVTFSADTDWDAVLTEAEKQAALGLAVNAAPPQIQKEWISKTSLVTAHFVRVLHFQHELCELLTQNHIPFVILKGTAAAIYYPAPIQRSMGDIDFLVPAEHFESARVLLKDHGYDEKPNEEYIRHEKYTKDDISFEMHRYFSDNQTAVEDFILEGLAAVETGEIDGVTFPMLPALANGLVLLEHLSHHLKSSLGLRQVIDWMMFVNRELNDEFWIQSFQAAAKEAGLETLALTAARLCQLYLGLPESITWCRSADDSLCDDLMSLILSSGNFGRKRGTGRSIEQAIVNLKKKGFRYLQTAGELNWKACQKHKWLRPFAWIYQICRYIHKGFQAKRSGSELREDLERGVQRNELLNRLNIL